MGRQRGFLPPALCQQCGKPPDLGNHLWPGDKWRCVACLEGHLPGKDAVSKSINQMIEYTQWMQAGFAREAEGSNAQEFRNRAEWARVMGDEIRRQGTTRAKEAPQANGETLPRLDENPL